MRLWLLLFLFSLGCTGTISQVPSAIRKFSPEPAVEASTRKALERWVGATGIGLRVSEDGIPVIVQDDWIYVRGKTNCGHIDFVSKEIKVTPKRESCDYYSLDSLVAHEIGHAIAGTGQHSDTGIMARGGEAENRECIDSASLELVCRTADCEVFEPECP